MTLSENKRLSFETLFDRGKVRVIFNMHHPDVLVPESARRSSRNGKHIALDYSRRFAMPNFKVTDEGIGAVLSFGGRSERTYVSWEAVCAVAQNGNLVEAWEDKPEKWSRQPDPAEEVSGPDRNQIVGVLENSPDLVVIEISAEEMDEDDLKWLSKDIAEG